jgi:hypothetical protein
MSHPIHGKGALVMLGTTNGGAASPVANQLSWSLDFDMSIVDVSPLNSSGTGQGNWKQFVKGMKGWTGTFAGNFDEGATQLWYASILDNYVNFYLYPNYSNNQAEYYYGTAWIQLGKIAEGSTTSKASSGFKATGDGPLFTNPASIF